MSFSIVMDVYGDNIETGHHDRLRGRESQQFETAEELSVFWEANKSFERKGKARGKAKKKPLRQLSEELGTELVNQLIADSSRGFGK